MRSYLDVYCCFIVHDLPLLENSFCSPVCVGLVGDPGWTNIAIQNSGWTFERLPSVWHGRKQQFPVKWTHKETTVYPPISKHCFSSAESLLLTYFWNDFLIGSHFTFSLTWFVGHLGSLRRGGKKQKVLHGAIKEFLCVLLRLTRSCNHHMIGFSTLYDCH